ncbi:MAG: 30S ribosomal protein S2 [Verrucomicrobiae bacterium]|nr:30S ribosomal protein S2 [Verrucomicrobiae bacterium]
MSRAARQRDGTQEGRLPNVTVQQLLEAGVHFGHQTKRWNPKMKKFIFAERNGIHIIDLTKTLTQIQVACGFLYDTVMNNGTVLFVGTKKQAQQPIKEAALRTGMPYVVDRWLGGTLTNLHTIRQGVKRMQQVDQLLASAESAQLPKKELAALRREHYKLHRNLDGIVTLQQLPDALFVVDIAHEEIPVREAQRTKIPIIALVDTNCDPDMVTYPIAGNDDAIRSIRCITNIIVETILEAQAELGKQIPLPAEHVPAASAAETPVPTESAPSNQPN